MSFLFFIFIIAPILDHIYANYQRKGVFNVWRHQWCHSMTTKSSSYTHVSIKLAHFHTKLTNALTHFHQISSILAFKLSTSLSSQSSLDILVLILRLPFHLSICLPVCLCVLLSNNTWRTLWHIATNHGPGMYPCCRKSTSLFVGHRSNN